LFIVAVLITNPVGAIPVTGVATDVTSNNFTVPIAGAVGDTWIAWGGYSGYLSWGSGIETAPASITVYGAPIIGGQTIYYKACDSTGCGNERSLIIPAITTVPTPNFGAAYRNLSNRHFAITAIPGQLLAGYTYNGTPWILLVSIIFFCIGFGYFFRTRSVRLALIMLLLLAPFAISAYSGLYLGIALPFQMGAQMLIPAMFAAVIISFMK
jgi:hypothetical protein